MAGTAWPGHTGPGLGRSLGPSLALLMQPNELRRVNSPSRPHFPALLKRR